jgi:hypothetical protein
MIIKNAQRAQMTVLLNEIANDKYRPKRGNHGKLRRDRFADPGDRRVPGTLSGVYEGLAVLAVAVLAASGLAAQLAPSGLAPSAFRPLGAVDRVLRALRWGGWLLRLAWTVNRRGSGRADRADRYRAYASKCADYHYHHYYQTIKRNGKTLTVPVTTTQVLKVPAAIRTNTVNHTNTINHTDTVNHTVTSTVTVPVTSTITETVTETVTQTTPPTT